MAKSEKECVDGIDFTPLKNGRYSVRVRIKDPDTGYWRWSKSKKLEAGLSYAERIAAGEQYRRDLQEDPLSAQAARNESKAITISQLIDDYESMRSRAVSLGRIKQRTLDAEAYLWTAIRQRLGGLHFNKLSAADIESFYVWTKDTRGFSDYSWFLVHQRLDRLIKYGMKNGYRKQNPMDRVEEVLKPKKPKANKMKPSSKRFTASQALEFSKRLRVYRPMSGQTVLLFICLTTGLRRGEAEALRWDDLWRSDADGNLYLSVNKDIAPDRKDDTAKTETSIRIVSVPRILETYLSEWSEIQRRKFEDVGLDRWVDPNTGQLTTLAGNHGSKFGGFKLKRNAVKVERGTDVHICTVETGEPIGYFTFDRWRKRFFVSLMYDYDLTVNEQGEYELMEKDPKDRPSQDERKALMKEVPTAHALRKLYISTLHRAGIPTIDIQAAAGHSDMATTARNYITPEESIKPALAAAIDSAFGQEPKRYDIADEMNGLIEERWLSMQGTHDATESVDLETLSDALARYDFTVKRASDPTDTDPNPRDMPTE